MTFLIGFLLGFVVKDFQDGVRKPNADLIVEGVEKYNAKYGLYPENLEPLKGEFLTEIPGNYWGLEEKGFGYTQTDSGANFVVFFHLRDGYKWMYRSGEGWSHFD